MQKKGEYAIMTSEYKTGNIDDHTVNLYDKGDIHGAHRETDA